ncbi:GNAT family N-acetyltransferase [Kordiimonas pumila]|uniref:GNAT family N-acetyltransferase n=1 Tax=Kordiimonas pumila TaxID=2161677 RepID=A0ABV7D436_9PROT|nr:GNAT family N-acetyltransferase [Kordiimonas pumila]
MTLEIQQATAEDVGVIQQMLVELACALGKPGGYKGTPESLLKYGFSNKPAFEVMLAYSQGMPVGLVLYFFEFSTWRSKPGIYVQDLYVADSARGLGVGRRLTAAAIQRAAAQGATYMRLSVHASNREAAAFYKAVGFTEAADECMMVLEGPAFTEFG